MALLDKANTESYGNPVPTTVPLTIEKGPFIVVTGHDLKDLELLLKQTEGKGINIYTHGEMLPAHAYPKLKAYKHLKGNFGTAWQNQQKEFDKLPAPILFTTNCLMPPRAKLSGPGVYTTEVVSFPGVAHIDEQKRFCPCDCQGPGTGRLSCRRRNAPVLTAARR
jgi:hydroxylamine reductase